MKDWLGTSQSAFEIPPVEELATQKIYFFFFFFLNEKKPEDFMCPEPNVCKYTKYRSSLDSDVSDVEAEDVNL